MILLTMRPLLCKINKGGQTAVLNCLYFFGVIILMNFIKKHKNAIVYIMTIVVSLLFIYFGNIYVKTRLSIEGDAFETCTAKVLKITDVEHNSLVLSGTEEGKESFITDKTIFFDALITSGTRKGEIVSATQSYDSIIPINPKDVEETDKIVLTGVREGDETSWFFGEYNRITALVLLCLFFFLLIIVFGRVKGVNTIITLILTVLIIFMVYVPSILSCYNVYTSTLINGIFIIFMTLLIVDGPSKKTLCAIMGNVGGLLMTALLTRLMLKSLFLTGIVDDHAVFLLTLPTKKMLDLNGLIFGGIVIGSLGATMDVAMSISSALNELAENMDKKSFKTMAKSGFNIGRDAMSTMTNTLILAYIGSSLSVVLLLVANNPSPYSLFNREKIVIEIIQALVGSIGILFTIPISTILSAYVYNLKPGRAKSKEEK